jgi:inorganic pyrophosphatase
MSQKRNGNTGLADPSRLSSWDPEEKQLLQVIIETPKGSRNKYAFDEEDRIVGSRKVLPAGMAFLYDFGFVPSTLAENGDPVDVPVLMDEPAFPGGPLKRCIIGDAPYDACCSLMFAG